MKSIKNNKKIKNLFLEIEEYLKSNFNSNDVFVIVYGSCSNNTARIDSDIDLFLAINRYIDYDLKLFKNFVIDIHNKYELKLDNEVPYENKLIVNFKDINDAVSLKGIDCVDNKFVVPKVIKNKKFLSSTNIKLRLVFNALTVPHYVLGNKQHKEYLRNKRIAEKNLLKLALDLLEKDKDLTINNLLQALLKSNRGEFGEMFLGYKKKPLVLSYLKNILKKELKNIH